MPRPKAMMPKYEFHISGQARVRFCGVDYYLGKHGSPESYAKYHKLIGEYLSNGQKPPEILDDDAGVVGQADESKVHLGTRPTTIRDLTADFRARKLPKYVSNPAQHTRFKNLLLLLEQWYGDESPDEFGPVRLETMRDKFVADGCSRKYANTKTKMVVQIFKHGVARQLVGPERIIALQLLEPLAYGEAREATPRRRITLDDVTATLKHLAQGTQDLVRVQLYTAARPSELFKMTPRQIDRSGPTWFYRPASHKTERHGKGRAIPLNSHAVEILSSKLFGDPDELIFRTFHGTPWNRNSYRQAVVRACEFAKVEQWTPYALRHLAAQLIRDSLGAEAVQAGLGHARIDMAETYSSAAEALAAKAAAVIPAVG